MPLPQGQSDRDSLILSSVACLNSQSLDGLTVGGTGGA